MKKFIIAGLFLLAAFSGSSQSTNIRKVFQSNFAKAEEMYRELAFRNALELYLGAARKDSLNPVVQQRIADCYVRLGKPAEAEHWYAMLVNSSKEVSPLYVYQYAQVLSSRGKYKDAQKWFEEYRKLSPTDTRGQSKIEFLKHIDFYRRDSLLYEIKNEPYNSDQSDFAPQYFNDGTVFVSARDRDMFIKHQSTSALNDKETMLNIYFASAAAAVENDAVFFGSGDVKSVFHDGPIVFFDNNRKAAFSRTNLRDGKPVTKDGKVNLGLHFGELGAGNVLTKVEAFEFNDDAFSMAHPWMSEDGKKLLFTSNQPGGIGGADLYLSERTNGQWSTPVNLGAVVNTPGDEFYPFLTNDSTLYFSSNGHGGLGGLDNYISIKRRGQWSVPLNLGSPLNSAADDFSLVVARDGRRGMFSSDRSNGVGYDDVYSFVAKSFSIVGRTVDKLDPKKPVASAKVRAKDVAGHSSFTTVSDEQGYFYLDVPFDRAFRFVGEKNGYTSLDTLSFSTATRTMGRDSVLVKLWEHSLFAKGKIYSNESQETLSDATVVIKNLTDGKIDSMRTADGSYNFELAPNKKYIISAHRDGFIPREFELNTAGIMTGALMNDMVLEEEFKEKIVIQFDFEKWDIKPAGHASLDKVARSMMRNKKFHLHIGAYADARGTHEFNLNLSHKRATATVQYLESRGVPASRITAIGFGEELLLNQCSNGVICHDDEHAKNRRAELKIQ
jgi:outer membrane protein OmpA-like peptidoglycan-associated protein/tetratricopeptide (TPR) repeat protein